ncbi:hypothetical protein F4825DRAFT_86927 [Nemania diffusa]|nr:hypothetical protein F4825DRAFT_86927 [Nemania diffusa]
MSSSGQPFGSNNPFRRTPGAASVNPAASSSTSINSSFDVDGSPAASAATTTRPPFTTFKASVPATERRDEEEQPVQQQKPKKIVKKVRVQSPPPSSPEDAAPVTRFPALEELDGNSDDDDDSTSDSSKSDNQADDPFSTASIDPDNQLVSEPPLPQIPPNPFARTLQDIEGKGHARDGNPAAVAIPTTSKGSLDVDSFKRLLLTGYSNLPNPPQISPASARNPVGTAHSPVPLPDETSATDASSVSKQSMLDALQETPRTSHEISESEALEDRKGVFPSSPLATVPSAVLRKKPPPPSSKHGKLIKIELGAEPNSRSAKPPASGAPDLPSPSGTTPRKASSDSIAPAHSPPGVTNVNKPLPAPPLRAFADDDVESPFDREAAGKVPEAFAELQARPQPPISPPTARSRSGSQTSTQSRKPAAPPPRRHGRSDSKIPAIYSPNPEEEPPRSSIESNRSRAESLRISVNSEKLSQAPAPPPPRRPGHTRQGSSFASINYGGLSPALSPPLSEKERSPLGSSFAPMAFPGIQPVRSNSLSSATAGLNGQAKISPPPPPPTRKQSVRRPPSIRSVETSHGPAPVRRVSREKNGGAPPPPPPPPRPRTWGSGRSNPDSSALGGEGLRKGSVGSMSAGEGSATPTIMESGKSGDGILADLDALQREVDELMKKGGN